MILREISTHINKLLKDYPTVVLLGPRQCGKTTLARSFKSHYFDLEQESERIRLNLEWDELTSHKELLILDEVQLDPEIFRRLRGTIDADRKRMGRFLLLGSVAPHLIRETSQSLAGRAALIELTPFSFKEVILSKKSPKNMRSLWLYGGFPDGGFLKRSHFPEWQKNYLTLLAQGDFPLWGLPANPQTMLRMMKMLAHFHGGVWNASKIGGALGLNYKTVNSYLDFLENTFLIRKLMPFHANIKKRLVKSPKVYWRDTGLLHNLLNINQFEDLVAHPQAGMSWEGFVIEQIITALSYTYPSFSPFFFRTSDGYELDLVIDLNYKERWAFEIKLTSCPTLQDLEALEKAGNFIQASKKILISQVKTSTENKDTMSSHLKEVITKILQKNL